MNYLLEIGTEEIPAHLVDSSSQQLKERTENFLNDSLIDFDEIKTFSTPRRLTIIVKNIAEKSRETDDEFRGPSIKVAKDNDGNWSKAAIGFAKSKEASVESLFEKDGYFYLNKKTNGIETAEILKNIGVEVISEMKFSTYMKWANFNFQFVRPIRWIVSLLDKKIIEFELNDLKSSNFSKGHRFLSTKMSETDDINQLAGANILINDVDQYVENLENNFVIVDSIERKKIIEKQIDEIAQQQKWTINIDENLLDEVNNLVEYPTTLFGDFDEKYLDLPKEVLITSMKENQRYFYVEDDKDNLLPHFIVVRNGNDEFLNNIKIGNQKVLVARLEDAEFFYNDDLKHSIEYFMQKVDKLIFHAKIGPISEHMKRAKVIGNLVQKQLKIEIINDDLKRVFDIYKFDLTSSMVNEFNELQGIIGGYYAKHFNENDVVSAAISEQYLPIVANGETPTSKLGSILSLADKIDTLISFFAAGFIPSGANDPYALRRAANGVISIILNNHWKINLEELISEAIDNYKKYGYQLPKEVIDNLPNVKKQIADFLADRIRSNNSDVNKTILDVALSKINNLDVNLIQGRINQLSNISNDDNFEDIFENLKRVNNISEKNKVDIKVDSSLFENNQESDLNNEINDLTFDDDLNSTYKKLSKISPLIEKFFETTVVMSEDPNIKNNRLALLQNLNAHITRFGDISKLITK